MKNVILESKFIRTLALVSSLLLGAFNAQATVILSFDETDVEVGLNETFELDLYATTSNGSDSFNTFSLDLGFDSILANTNFELGSAFDLAPIGPFFNMGFGTAVGSKILLGTYTFVADGYGMTSVETLNLNFQSLGLPSVEVQSASANISVVSAPATLGLFTIALAGLVSLRRKA